MSSFKIGSSTGFCSCVRNLLRRTQSHAFCRPLLQDPHLLFTRCWRTFRFVYAGKAFTSVHYPGLCSGEFWFLCHKSPTHMPLSLKSVHQAVQYQKHPSHPTKYYYEVAFDSLNYILALSCVWFATNPSIKCACGRISSAITIKHPYKTFI